MVVSRGRGDPGMAPQLSRGSQGLGFDRVGWSSPRTGGGTVESERVDWLVGAAVAGVLPGAMIRDLLRGEPPLATGLPSPDDQVQPNGLDLTLAEVHRHTGPGRLATANAD